LTNRILPRPFHAMMIAHVRGRSGFFKTTTNAYRLESV
jgi:hypothetical protein